MANADTPFGFKPLQNLAGGAIRTKGGHAILGTYATKIFGGDVVHLNSSGYVELAAAGDANLIGVFAGCKYVDTNGKPQWSPYWPAPGAVATGTTVEAFVYTDPNMSFVAQTATGVAFARTHIGNNVDFVATHSGSTAFGESAQEIDLSAPGTATANFRILGLAPWPNNDFGEHAKVEVRFNEHLFQSATGV